MKDTTSTSSRHSRHAAYPPKRPSPHGIKKRKDSSPSHTVTGRSACQRSPAVSRTMAQFQKARQQQVMRLHRQGVFIEDEYRDEIQAYMHEMELLTLGSVQQMDSQPEIKWHMRPCLIDFITEVHFTFRLRPETLYLTMNIIDRYVSRRVVYVKHYQLVGCAALWIASKFEDAKERVPTVQDLVNICQDAYDESAFVQMEGHVLQTIEWTLGHPTAESWLRLLCTRSLEDEDLKTQHVARFLMEITLFHREFIRYTPSAIALGSLTLARYLCGFSAPAFTEQDICMEVVEHLDNRLAHHVDEISETLIKKYSYAFYSKAATFVIQHYLQGGRFQRQMPIAGTYSIPATPTRSPKSMIISTPMSASTDASDDMPATPIDSLTHDPLSASYEPDAVYEKENAGTIPVTFAPILNKNCVDSVPDNFLPHDFLAVRPALQALNPPRVVSVV